MEKLNVTASYLCSGPVDGLRLCISLTCVSDSAAGQVRMSKRSEAMCRSFNRQGKAWRNGVDSSVRALQIGGAQSDRDQGDLLRSATEEIGWQETISCLEANGPARAPRPLIFTHVHEDGILQRTELQRSATVGGRHKTGRAPNAMALAVRADAAGKVDVRQH